MAKEYKSYTMLPTIKLFHESPAQIRCIVGPVGSGKTTGATWDMCYYRPMWLAKRHNIKRTSWVIVRNTYRELEDTTMKTVFEWFPWGDFKAGSRTYTLRHPDGGPEVEILFRSCDRPDDMKKFKSLEITGYWIDESIEVPDAIKRMLKNRIGRYPRKCPVRFGIETTNPPDVENTTYTQFKWHRPPPGPVPEGTPLENHAGFWQPPHENDANLRPGYYDDLRSDYTDTPDWIDMYVEGKPGIIIKGKLVYNNFRRDYHVAKEPLIWARGQLIRGWDDSGNTPACVVLQVPRARHIQVLKEFWTDREGIVDFGKRVVMECNMLYPGAEYIDWDDPAGHNEYSKRDGGFTSNAQLMEDECGIKTMPSDNNLTARLESVEQALKTIDGLLIDPSSCTRLVNGFLGGYCYKEIGNTGMYHDKPEKNRFSHPHDALQYPVMKLLAGGDTRKDIDMALVNEGVRDRPHGTKNGWMG